MFKDVEATNDVYIDKLLNDPTFVTDDEGNLYKKSNDEFIKIGGLDCYGYVIYRPRWNNGRRVKIAVHRVIYAKYHGALDPKKVVDHINGNRADNRPSNLRLISWEENRQHRN